MTRNPQSKFEADRARLLAAFEAGNDPGQTDEDLGTAILELILQLERARHGVLKDASKWPAIDNATLQKMQRWDTDDPELAFHEKVLRRFASNRAGDAVTILKSAIIARSRVQSARAKKPRPKGKHPITLVIDKILAANPEMTAHDLCVALKGQLGQGVIHSFSEDAFHLDPSDDNGWLPMKRTALKDHIYRAKKKKSR